MTEGEASREDQF